VLLTKKEERSRNSFKIQEELMTKIKYLESQGLKVESKVQAGGPPSGKAVGIKLTADDPDKLNELKRISLEFENFLKNTPGTVNISNSSKTNPGQFAFTFDDKKLAELGLTPTDVQFELYSALNGSKAGTITLDKEDRDILVKYDSLDDKVTPEKVLDTPITTRNGSIKL
jgi:multidrug efflux pump subunit AcrB